MRIPSVAASVILVETPLIRGATAAQITSLRNTIFIKILLCIMIAVKRRRISDASTVGRDDTPQSLPPAGEREQRIHENT
jgi:hypothetical protein